MRVIAGRLRGATIRTPRTTSVRPTYDRVRESLFSIIEPRLSGARVLDLYAGSGSLGIESLSRGAISVTFVEIDRKVASVVRGNLDRLGLSGDGRVIGGDALSLLDGSMPGAPFDLVFVDPPYGAGLAVRTLRSISLAGVLEESALVIVEHETAADIPEVEGRLTRYRLERYGSTSVGFYEVRGEEPGREEAK